MCILLHVIENVGVFKTILLFNITESITPWSTALFERLIVVRNSLLIVDPECFDLDYNSPPDESCSRPTPLFFQDPL
jgi:hypothetical protein